MPYSLIVGVLTMWSASLKIDISSTVGDDVRRVVRMRPKGEGIEVPVQYVLHDIRFLFVHSI
jgi:hypothetical protein